MAPKTIFISVGDDSGDLHASNFMRAVRARDASVEFVGFGMERMKAAGLKPLGEGQEDRGSAMWLHNVLRFAEFGRRLAACRRFFRERRPDLVVLVDFGGFNMFVAKAAARAGIPVLYYILPQLWAHGRYRIKKVRKWVTRPLVIYPFEPELYRRCGVEVEYVGHPLFDELSRTPPDESKAAELRRAMGERLIALFPGSRRQEVRANLPIMLAACSALSREFPDATFAAVTPPRVRPVAQEILRGAACRVELLDVPPVLLAHAARLCITKSGTITLEVASQLRPMVIFYRVGAFPYFLARGVAQTPYIGLVNTLAGRMVCPEKVMWRAEPTWVAVRAREFLRDPSRYERCRSDLARVMEGFARPGASERAARVALELLG